MSGQWKLETTPDGKWDRITAPEGWILGEWGYRESREPASRRTNLLEHKRLVDIVRKLNSHGGLLAACKRLLDSHEADTPNYDAARYNAMDAIAEAEPTCLIG